MKNITKKLVCKSTVGESGQALILVLVFFLLGSLMLAPVLMQMQTALKSETMYEDKTNEISTTDAGLENGMWRIKYDYLGPDYDPYDFNTVWSYETDPVNGQTAAVTVQNVWLPTNVTLNSLGLSSADAKTIAEAGKLVVTGTSGAVPGQPYRIKIDFTPAAGDNLTIKSMGIWLPQGFSYTVQSSTLEAGGPFEPYYPNSVSVSAVPGGQSVVWSYNPPYPLFTSFPDLVSNNGTLTSTITFNYSPPANDPDKLPVAVAWITAEMHDTAGNPVPNPDSPVNVPIAWDTDTSFYKITSSTGNTKIEAYTSKLGLRSMGDAASGDYVATGNSLMIMGPEHPSNPHGIRYDLLTSSDAAVSTIPSDGDVMTAYLYWSGWRNNTTVFSDPGTSTNFNNYWVNGGDWAYSSNSYQGHHSGADSRRYLTLKNAQNLSSYPSGTLVEIDWTQSVPALTDIFSDSCSSSNFTNSWSNGGDWSYYSSGNDYRGQHLSGADSQRYLTVKTGQNLSGYSSVNVSWSQSESGTLNSSDFLYYNFSSDNGTTWSNNITAGSAASFPATYSSTIPSQYFTNGFKIRFYIAGFGSGKYCYLDNIKITPSYSASDGLDFALYNGTSWSSNIQAFRGGNPSGSFSYIIPDAAPYLNSNFLMRFYLVGMGGSQEYCRVSSISIIVRQPDNSVMFKINGVQYSLDNNGNPQTGGEVTATTAQVLVNNTGYSYACRRDVTALVKKYPVVPGEQHHTGNATYTVGNVQADTGNEISYAGWSLIIVYNSPETAGHYLYLRDVFSYNGGNSDCDFDGDGQPGGDISGFVIPDPIKDKYGNIIETNAASITCFVGEGDWCYAGDYIALNAPDGLRSNPTDYNTYESYKLWDGITIGTSNLAAAPYVPNNAFQPDNVWNSYSQSGLCDGVDIKTFNVPWTSQLLKPGDTKLHLDLYTQVDNYNLIYIILSVRSKTVTTGAQNYSINLN